MTDAVIHRCKSAFHTIFVSRDEEGVVTIQFEQDGPCQSVLKPEDVAYLELPYSRVLPLFLGVVPDPKRMLILGLGGGTLPRFFHRFLPKTSIDVVEIDPVVLDVATRFCGLRQGDRLSVHIADGRDFIEGVTEPYDVIVLDGFDSSTVPVHLRTLEFLSSVRRALSPQGIAVGNVWGRKHNQDYDHMLATYRAAFDQVYVLDVPAPGTKILLALPRQLTITRAELIQRAEHVFRRRGFDYRPSEVIAGFRPVDQEKGPRGEVLRD